uniref:Uncharacterized protein n=1 Tax=Cannabis sativa TaxID=3483 RepID=A0A803P9L9_CANSA
MQKRIQSWKGKFLSKADHEVIENVAHALPSYVIWVFEAIYYPPETFLSAVLGQNPSFICKSIFETQDIIKSGVHVRISLGLSVNILNSPWLPNAISPYVISLHPSLVDAKLNQLLAMDCLEWDEEIVNDLYGS